MGTVIYINWYDREIMTEQEFVSAVAEKAEENFSDDWKFDGWMNEHYSASEVWDASDDYKEDIMARWRKYCEDEAEDDLGYEKVEI